MKNSEQPAFPIDKDNYPVDSLKTPVWGGLTKREYFAAMALSGIMGNPNTAPCHREHWRNIAVDSVRAADELLKQLES